MSRATTSDKADELRSDAKRHPTIASLRSELPELPSDHEAAPGLYVESGKTAGIVVNGELRVSVLRIYSVDEEGEHLIGQAQATCVLDHPLDSWSIRFYTHDQETFQTQRIENQDAWFVAVLERHYRSNEVPVQVEDGIEA